MHNVILRLRGVSKEIFPTLTTLDRDRSNSTFPLLHSTGTQMWLFNNEYKITEVRYLYKYLTSVILYSLLNFAYM